MLLPSSWTCVIIGCLLAHVAGTSSLSDLYPPLWHESPGQLSDYREENGKYIIDPWIYPERMGLYKILLNQTAKYFAKFAPENEQNILWGLPLQHGWQYLTGRLAKPTQKTKYGHESGDRLFISVDSWWADGTAPDKWWPVRGTFSSTVHGLRPAFAPDHREGYLQSPSSHFDDLLKYLWTAHTSTLEHTIGKFEDRYEYYTKPEADFARNWIVAMEYFAASLFPTTLTRVHKFQKGLPPRLLVTGDVAPFISDFTDFQNTVLFYLNYLFEVDESTGRNLCQGCCNRLPHVLT